MQAIPRLSRAKLSALHKLTQKKYRRLEKKFIVEGSRLVEEALDSDWGVEEVLICETLYEPSRGSGEKAIPIERKAKSRGCMLSSISEKDLNLLSDTESSQGILALVSARDITPEAVLGRPSGRRLIVALEDVADPGNVGSIIRTCDWFGADGVLLDKDTVEVFNPKVLRSTMGSVFHLPVADADFAKILPQAKRKGFRLVATALRGGKPLHDLGVSERTIVLFGSEARGISEGILGLADEVITIPRFGRSESLNVSVACGLILAYYRA